MNKFIYKIVFLLIISIPVMGFTCDVCRGDPNASMSQGMDMAILTLLGITCSVLGCFATFFVHLKKQSLEHQNQSD